MVDSISTMNNLRVVLYLDRRLVRRASCGSGRDKTYGPPWYLLVLVDTTRRSALKSSRTSWNVAIASSRA